jgi:hypothetical protein
MKITFPRIALLACGFVFIFSTESKSQSTFVRMYNKGNMGYTVREVNGNSYVVAGGTDYYFNWHWFIQSSLLNTNIHLFKTDANGVLQWERVIGKPNTRMVARWMEPTTDGGFIVTGFSNQDVVWPPDSNDVVLLKTDGSGLVSWCKVYDSGKDDLGYSVQQTSDGGYIVGGFHDAVPISLALNTYLLLIKTDQAGVIQWEKKYQFAIRDLNTHEPFSYVVKQTADGGYVVAGTNAVTHPADVEVLRLDATGNVLWAKTYEHDASAFRNSVGLDIIETTTGDFVIAGSMDKVSPAQINYPYFLKISSTGSVIKQKFYETIPLLNFQSGFSSVQQTTDGGFFFTGMGGYSDFGDQAQLLRTNSNLDMLWSRVYTMDGTATVGSMSGRETSDGGYVFTGKRQMTGTVLMKTNGSGLVACKIPNALIEYIPSVTVSNWNPTVISGMNTNNVLLNVSSPMIDTTVVCPLTITSLPIDLQFFNASANGKEVLVNWTSASELNNNYYSVERSRNNLDFEEAGTVQGAGNSNSVNFYSYTDRHPYLSGISYYRLKQVDIDGTSHLTKSIPVSFNGQSISVTATYAQSNVLRIFISSSQETTISYNLVNTLGDIIKEGSKTLSDGMNDLTIHMENNPQGVYYLRLNALEMSTVRKIFY